MSAPFSPLQAAPGRYDSIAYEKEKLVVDKPCYFLAVSVFNNGAAPLYLMVMDAATEAAGLWPGTHRGGIVEVPPQTARSLDWSLLRVDMRAGLYVCVSTDPTTKALPATNDALFSVSYAV